MIKAIIDTTIYVSALHFGGTALEVIQLGHKKRQRIQIYISHDILQETVRVLTSAKFGWSDTEVKKVISYILMIAVYTEPSIKVNVVEDSADNRVLEAAVFVEADVIVTGDKKLLLPLKEFRGTKILSARTLLNSMKS